MQIHFDFIVFNLLVGRFTLDIILCNNIDLFGFSSTEWQTSLHQCEFYHTNLLIHYGKRILISMKLRRKTNISLLRQEAGNKNTKGFITFIS